MGVVKMSQVGTADVRALLSAVITGAWLYMVAGTRLKRCGERRPSGVRCVAVLFRKLFLAAGESVVRALD